MVISTSAAYYSESLLSELAECARQLRLDSLAMIHRRGAGHPGGSLSAAEIMAALFFHKLNLDPARPDWPERDRFILSKGHASAILYATLARRGFFPQSDLEHWGDLDCHLQGHPDRLKTPGIDMTSGLLGHGIAIGAGWRWPRVGGLTTGSTCFWATANVRAASFGKAQWRRPSSGFRT